MARLSSFINAIKLVIFLNNTGVFQIRPPFKSSLMRLILFFLFVCVFSKLCGHQRFSFFYENRVRETFDAS